MAFAAICHNVGDTHEARAALFARRSLAQLMAGIVDVPAILDRPISDVASDSRRVGPGAVFFAASPDPPKHHGGESFIPQAIAAGAVAVVRRGSTTTLRVEQNAAGAGVVSIAVADPIKTLACVADRWLAIDASQLQLIGITGTNGKSSVAHCVAQALTQGGFADRCGILGTLGSGIFSASEAPALQPQALTTPDLLSLRRRLAQLAKAGAMPLVLEVSSHALAQRRTEGLAFRVAVFTNLSHDHLDYHDTMARYWAAKRRLFDDHRVQAAVINMDDAYGQQLARELAAELPVYGFCTDIGERMTDDKPAQDDADSGTLKNLREHLQGWVRYSGVEGLRLEVRIGAEHGLLHSRLLGRFNACNLMASLAVLRALGVAPQAALAALAKVSTVDGRMQSFGGGVAAPQVIVDFAHTPQALELALRSLRELCRGKLWCVFGCGGERDRSKRALMGKAAAAYADRIVITDDNPRNEDGDAIVNAIVEGLPWRDAALIERDRRAAILLAVESAAPDDVVLIAGKGHERHQQYGRHKRNFCDAESVTEALARRP